MYVFFFKQKTADEMRISDWSSDVCSSDLEQALRHPLHLRVTVARLDADQRQQPGADGAEGVAVDGDAGGGDALDEGEHGWLGLGAGRSEERSVGKEWVSTCRSRLSPHPLKQNI